MLDSSKSQNDTSLSIFRSFMVKKENGELDCKGVVSRECYNYWLNQRKILAINPEEAFRKVLTAHVRGNWGRKPFDEIEEKSILKLLRKKKIWPCFENTSLRIGINGFRALGFHEQIQKHGKIKEKSKLQVKGDKTKNKKFLSSFDVFMMFGKATQGAESKILSRECFDTWVNTRRNGCKKPEFSFRKALIAHLTGKDGRRPFPEDVEKDVLIVLRKQETWPCFANCKERQYRSIGKKGCKQLGFHELKSKSEEAVGQKRSTDLEHSVGFKRRRVNFPTIYFNFMNEQNQVHDVLHYDPFQRYLSSFDMATDTLVDLKEESSSDFMTDENIFSFTEGAGALEDRTSLLLEFTEPKSILETFEDVTSEEVEQVILLRSLTKSLFDDYYQKIENKESEKYPSDLCGDVRLLRYLRVSRHNIKNTVKEIECALEWRLQWKVEKIRDELLKQNLSISMLRKSMSIGSRGGCYPFFSQADNGDITDIFVMQEQKYTSHDQSKADYLDHVKLNEYRSLVLDRMSYIKRRVVGCKVILDCNKVQSTSKSNWWTTVRNYSWYIKEMAYLHTRYYGGFLAKIHVFGQGYLFKLLFNSIGNALFDALLGNTNSTYGKPADHTEILSRMLGESSNWPRFYGGDIEQPENTDLANRTISKF